MRLCVASLALSISLVSALDVYVHPAPRISTGTLVGKEEGAAIASHHLGLDMFESLPRKAVFHDQANQDFVAKGSEKRTAALVITSESALNGLQSLKEPVMSLPDEIMTDADEIIDTFVDRAKYVYDTIAHYPSSASPSSLSSFTVYDLRHTPLAHALVEDILATSSHAVLISSSAPAMHKRQEDGEERVSIAPPQYPISALAGCFSSYETCANATDGCSGHGSCGVAKKQGRSCYMCLCEPSKEKEGKKTVTWAGQSCEKKDVSSSFALLAGTVIVLGLMAFGSVSLLYSVGDVELPSTLMAGAGPVKRD